jgi:hypothetical protein
MKMRSLKKELRILNLKFTMCVATLALGLQPKQRACKGVSQKEARESKQEEEATSQTPGNVRKCEGV